MRAAASLMPSVVGLGRLPAMISRAAASAIGVHSSGSFHASKGRRSVGRLGHFDIDFGKGMHENIDVGAILLRNFRKLADCRCSGGNLGLLSERRLNERPQGAG